VPAIPLMPMHRVSAIIRALFTIAFRLTAMADMDTWACFHQDRVGAITHRSGGTIRSISSDRAALRTMHGFQLTGDMYRLNRRKRDATRSPAKASALQADTPAHHKFTIPPSTRLPEAPVHRGAVRLPVRPVAPALRREAIAQAAAAEARLFLASVVSQKFFDIWFPELDV